MENSDVIPEGLEVTKENKPIEADVSSKPLPWELFRKFLDDDEDEAWGYIVWLAKQTGEAQKVLFDGLQIGIVWPSGLCQTSFKYQERLIP